MPSFRHGDVEIAYFDEGQPQAEPILLIHGFASNKEVNWVGPNWVTTLLRTSRRVIALDNRGHGQSTKLYNPADYHNAIMAEDARALLDHLNIERADVMGYSMGGRITAFLAYKHPKRVRSAIIGGIGARLVDGTNLSEIVAPALEARSSADVTDPQGRMYRAFAEQTKSDLKALAACIRGSRQFLTVEQVGTLEMPVLIAMGTKDTVGGSPHELAAMIPDARVVEIPGRDHMLAVGDKVYKTGVTNFLAERA